MSLASEGKSLIIGAVANDADALLNLKVRAFKNVREARKFIKALQRLDTVSPGGIQGIVNLMTLANYNELKVMLVKALDVANTHRPSNDNELTFSLPSQQ